MRFMVLVKPGRRDYEDGALPTAADLEAMGRFNDELTKAGMIIALDGLQPTSKGSRVRYQAGKAPTIIDGPFTETKELIGGFWILQAKSKDDVVAWMQRAPFEDGDEVEIRQIFELEDFGGVLTPETTDSWVRRREQLAPNT
jgi:hypothetical protein